MQPLPAAPPPTTPTQTNVPIVLTATTAPAKITTTSLAHLQEPGAGQSGTVISVATFSGSIDPQALLSAGWIVPNGNFPNFFQKDTLYGVVSLDTSNQTLTYSLNLVAPSVEALRSGQTLEDPVVVPTGASTSTTVMVTIDSSVPVGQNATSSVSENLPGNLTLV